MRWGKSWLPKMPKPSRSAQDRHTAKQEVRDAIDRALASIPVPWSRKVTLTGTRMVETSPAEYLYDAVKSLATSAIIERGLSWNQTEWDAYAPPGDDALVVRVRERAKAPAEAGA